MVVTKGLISQYALHNDERDASTCNMNMSLQNA